MTKTEWATKLTAEELEEVKLICRRYSEDIATFDEIARMLELFEKDGIVKRTGYSRDGVPQYTSTDAALAQYLRDLNQLH